MSIAVHHMKFLIQIGRAISSEGTTVIKSIWGEDTGRVDLSHKILDKYNCVMLAELHRVNYSGPMANCTRVYDYCISQSDLRLNIQNLIKFGDEDIDVIYMDNLDYSGLSLAEASGIFNIVKELCIEFKIPALVILSQYNKPSSTEHLFCGEGVEEKIPTWEINPEYAPLKDHYEELNARALLNYGCQ